MKKIMYSIIAILLLVTLLSSLGSVNTVEAGKKKPTPTPTATSTPTPTPTPVASGSAVLR